MSDLNSWFELAVAELKDPHNQRVWSIIVSLFGDLAQDCGAHISGGALTRIVEPMGIKPEAMRVALHRLRKDGWIESDRVGRVSMHQLTEFGRSQSARVTPRIYAREPLNAQNWHLLIAQDGPGMRTLDDVLLSRDYTPIGRTAALGSGPLPDHCDDLMVFDVNPRAVPKWVQDRAYPKDLHTACSSLHKALCNVISARPANVSLSAAQVATLRTLIVHRWRRVVLRQPDLPAAFYPQSWIGPDCRSEVFRLLDTLPNPELKEINGSA